ncbi:hypothetical protein BKX96_08395 [Pseudomonas putida]|nr:hypothetical protein BKX96_08395 [Pseudomonas putida]
MGTAFEHLQLCLATTAGTTGRLPAALPGITKWRGCPFPDVTDHVPQTVTIGRKCAHRRSSVVPIQSKVLPGKLSLPDIGNVASIRHKLVPPDKLAAGLTSPGCKFPFFLGGQYATHPVGISMRILKANLDHWM